MPPRKRKAPEQDLEEPSEGDPSGLKKAKTEGKEGSTSGAKGRGKGRKKKEGSEDEVSGDSDDEEGKTKKGKGRAKANGKTNPSSSKKKDPVVPLDPDQPTNTVMPATAEGLHLTPKDGTKGKVTRFAALNVAGLRAAEKKGFKLWVDAEEPDILVLTETKVNADPDILHLKHRYKYHYWGSDPQKGNAGTAVLCKVKPLSVVYGLPTHPQQDQTLGRCITLEFENSFLIATYTPNAGQNLKTLPTKNLWNQHFETYLRDRDSVKPLIWMGDINCARDEKDIRNAKTNWNKSPGYTAAECEALAKQLDPSFKPEEEDADKNDKQTEGKEYGKLIDVWRERNPDKIGGFTYYSYRFQCRSKGIGWRLDYFIVSERILSRVNACEIRSHCYGISDHVPIIADVVGDL